jgi:hypothetical protein
VTPPRSDASSLVSLPTEDLTDTLRPILDGYIDRLKDKPEVVGIVVLGGLARTGNRQFVDRSSDLDLVFFLSLPDLPKDLLRLPIREFIASIQPYLPDWLPNFKYNVPSSLTGLGWDVPMDNHQQVLEYEEQAHIVWDWHTLESYDNNNEVVYDPTGRVRKLVETKLQDCRDEIDKMLLKLFAFGRVLTDTVIEQCVTRRQFEQGHDIINDLLNQVTAAWYGVNNRFAPFTKWRIANLPSLTWLPPDAVGRYREAMLVHAHDAADLRRRRDGVVRFLDELEAYCKQTRPGWPQDAYVYAVNHIFVDRQLRESTAADLLPSVAGLGQNAKMEVQAWNEWNWMLHDSSASR